MPAAALVPKKISSGPSSIASLSSTDGAGSIASVSAVALEGAEDFGSGCGFILALHAGNSPREVLRVERLEVVEALADADGNYGKLKAFGDRDQDAAPRRAVELGHDQAGHAGDLLEDLHLVQRVLTRRRVEHEQDAVRRAVVDLLQHAHDLGELGHQVGLVLEPARGVDQEHVGPFGAGALQRLIGDTSRIGADLL